MYFSGVQSKIISRLKNADTLRYRDLRPSRTPNDLYNYHLKQLITKGLVTKKDNGYSLSMEGQRYAADTYHSSDKHNRLFKVNVITIASRLTDAGTEILNQTRQSQPSYGQTGVMGGTILKGESFAMGAARKFKQETGLRAEFRVLGIERRRLYHNEELFSDIIFPICYTDVYTGKLTTESRFGHNHWVSISRAIQNDSRSFDTIQSIPKVLQAIDNNMVDSLDFFFTESTQNLQET